LISRDLHDEFIANLRHIFIVNTCTEIQPLLFHSIKLGAFPLSAFSRAGFTYRLKPRTSRSKGGSNKRWYA